MFFSQLHPFLQQREIVKYCKENNIVVQAYSPIVQGKMDNPTITALAKKVRSTLTKNVDYNRPMIKTKKYNRDRAQILIRWSLQNGCVLFPFISTCLTLYLSRSYVPLPKSDTPSRIHSNANVYDFELAKDDVEKLDALDIGKAGAVGWNPVDSP